MLLIGFVRGENRMKIIEKKSKVYQKSKVRTPTPEPIDVRLEAVVGLIISNYPGVVQDVVENKSKPALQFLVGETIRVTHGTVKPYYIELELRNQLDSLHSIKKKEKNQR